MAYCVVRRSKTWHSNSIAVPAGPPVAMPVADREHLDAFKLSFAKTDQLVEWCLTSRKHLEAIREHFKEKSSLSYRVIRMLREYSMVDMTDAKDLGRFVGVNICEFEDLGAFWGVLHRSMSRDHYYVPLTVWLVMVEEVMTAAEHKYHQLMREWGEEERAANLHEDPIICAILGHFFMGCLIHEDLNGSGVRKKLRGLAKYSGFWSSVPPLFNGTPDSATLETQINMRVIGRHLMSMIHDENDASVGSFKARKRKEFATRVVQTMLGGDADGASVYATKLMCLFGPVATRKEDPAAYEELEKVYPLHSHLTNLASDRASIAANSQKLGLCAQYGYPMVQVFVDLKKSMKPIGWKSQGQRVYFDAASTGREIFPLVNSLRGRQALGKRLKRALEPETSKIVWFLTDITQLWYPENSAALALLVDKTVALDFIVKCQVLKNASHIEMTGLVLTGLKFDLMFEAASVIRSATRTREFERSFVRLDGPRSPWKHSVTLVTNTLLRHAFALEKRTRDDRVEQTPQMLKACTKESVTLVKALACFTAAIKEVFDMEADTGEGAAFY